MYRALGFDGVALGALVGAQGMGVVLGALPAARFARGHSRRSAILVGGVVTGAGVVGILTLDAYPPLLVAAALVGIGGITATSSGAALLADATKPAERATLFGQQIALGTIAAFVASAIAGALAAPVASLLGLPESDVRVLRALLAMGAAVAALSALPVLAIRRAAVPAGSLAAPHRRDLMWRFLVIDFCFGFGAGSFLPFTNLFFADRFGVSFGALGVILGALAVAGSGGAILHGRVVAPRTGAVRGVVLVELLSLPFALLAAASFDLPLAVVALAARAALMYGASATITAYTLSSFTPAERAGANAILAIAWNAAAALGSVISGSVRGALGDLGWSANLATLAAAYFVAALLTLRFFRDREPAGDVAGVHRAAVPDSTA